MGLQQSLGVPDWAKLMWGPFTPSLWAGTRTNRPAGNNNTAAASAAPTSESAAPPIDNPRDMRQAVDELRQQLCQLQQQLAAQSNHKKKRHRTSR